MGMTFVQLVTDNFTRANSNPISGNWGTVGAASQFQILTDMAQPSAASGTENLNLSTAITWGADQYSEITVGVAPQATDFGGPAVRLASGAKNGYQMLYAGGSGNVLIQKLVTGIGTTIGSSSTINVILNDVLRLVIIGNTLSGYQNGNQIIAPFTDTTYATGSAGIAAYISTGGTGNIRFSLWNAGSASSGNTYTQSYRDFIAKRGTDDTPPKYW